MANLNVSDSAFTRLLKFQPADGDEIRRDETLTDDYHGAAPDGASTASAVWKVCRFYKDVSGNTVRVRYKTGIAWDSRADSGNWS